MEAGCVQSDGGSTQVCGAVKGGDARSGKGITQGSVHRWKAALVSLPILLS